MYYYLHFFQMEKSEPYAGLNILPKVIQLASNQNLNHFYYRIDCFNQCQEKLSKTWK